jgi:16S rRNA (cytosine967-C5)-methyltransferase
MKSFREHHLTALLSGYQAQNLPLDLFISHYFKANKALGSKDRAEIAEAAYGMIRWQGLLDYIASSSQLEEQLAAYKSFEPKKWLNREDIPLHIRLSFPKVLFDLIVKSHGLDKAIELCLVSNAPAPTTVRANSLKISRETLMERWAGKYDIIPCEHAKQGITFLKKINFFELQEFKEGLFEVQDEGSQLLADLLKVQPGEWVLDYCAGSGGKTLAFAPQLEGKGQIFLHDSRPKALEEARKRLRRAGIQNAQIVQLDDPKLRKMKKKMHWVLVDAPCTGTGTMRRNPDMKWKFTEEMVLRLMGLQRNIFEKALSYLRPDGIIVYATCSLLNEENQEQTEHFIKTYDLEIKGKIFQTLPSSGGMDGFFGVCLKRKN